jgi:uncharacterized membrane protein required for colicin V production
MFAAAIHNNKEWYQNLTFNWFDLALVGLLMFGFWRGRKRGMSRECLPVLFWISVAAAGACGYSLLGDQFLNADWVKQVFGRNFVDRAEVFMFSYGLIALGVYLVFAILNRAFKAKLEGSNAFGGSEYYLGILAGIIRYACIVLVALALAHAPFYSAAEIAASKAYKLDTFGSKGVKGMENDTGDYIPDFSEIQAGIFKGSLIGPFIQDKLSMLLINAVPATLKTHGSYHN